MPSPFPGIDPYLESQHYWPDFHANFVPAWREAVGAALPGHYEARIDEQVEILELDPNGSRFIRPDVAVIHQPGTSPRAPAREPSGSGLATLEAVTIPFPVMEEVRERWIKIIHRPSRKLIAVLELLSPTNKTNPGRGQYLAKRSQLFVESLHIVEVDLLLGGQRLPMARSLPQGDFYVITARSDQRPRAEVYTWTLRDKLPVIPIPLLKPDQDIFVDMAAVYAIAFERGGYANSIDYAVELAVPLEADKSRWASETAKRAAT